MWCINLQEYFEGSRTEFSLTLNPEGTDFQKKGLASATAKYLMVKHFPTLNCPKP